MEDQRVPNLEEMDEEQAGQFLTGQGGTVGCRGGHRLRRWAGIRRGANPRVARRKDVARPLVLRRAVRGAGVEGAVGRADGNLNSRDSPALEKFSCYELQWIG
jgi:hypothetical protein